MSGYDSIFKEGIMLLERPRLVRQLTQIIACNPVAALLEGGAYFK